MSNFDIDFVLKGYKITIFTFPQENPKRVD